MKNPPSVKMDANFILWMSMSFFFAVQIGSAYTHSHISALHMKRYCFGWPFVVLLYQASSVNVWYHSSTALILNAAAFFSVGFSAAIVLGFLFHRRVELSLRFMLVAFTAFATICGIACAIDSFMLSKTLALFVSPIDILISLD